MLDLHAATVSATINSRDLRVGDFVIETRFVGPKRERVERAYEVVEVRAARFVNYVIRDEAGLSLRTYEGEVEIAGGAFRGEVFKA